MFSIRRKAVARVNPPDTTTGNGIARSFSGHTNPNDPIEFVHNQGGFPSILVLDTDGNAKYAQEQDEVPRAGWAQHGEVDVDIFVKYPDKTRVLVWTTLTSGVISID